jgi:tRNA pseudouridine38-40 synthase
MRNLKLILSYDGSDFAGWQVQPGVETIQGLLASAIGRLTGENVLPQGSGRTDAGVHALAQVATFATESAIPVENFRRALNGMLPGSIRVMDVREVATEFHARKSARGKTYRYRMYRGEVCSPFVARYVWHYPYPLDEAAMVRAAAEVVGERDFTSFAAVDEERRAFKREGREEGRKSLNHEGHEGHEGSLAGSNVRRIVESSWDELEEESKAFNRKGREEKPREGREEELKSLHYQGREVEQKSLNHEGHEGHEGSQGGARSNVRRIFESSWEREGEEFVYTVRGSGFLHHMVRNLVGTFVLVGKGTLAVEDIRRILEARKRSAAGATAPAGGLCLMNVEY